MTNLNEITKFAKTNFRNREVVFGIKTDDRRRHMYIIGKTGMGKTNLLEHLVSQDIKNGHGVAYVDPHGDTSEKLTHLIPPERIKDVIYFNPADQDFPIAFNVMERVDPAYRHLVASGLVGVFKKLWADSWGPRLEYILRNALLALLEYPESTLLGVMRILVDKKYQKEVASYITDPVVRSFWVDEFTKWNDRVLQEVIAPIQNKVGQFLSSSLIRNIVGQTESSFNIRQAMDEKKILIFNLSKGRIGEDNSALLGAMMITKIQLAAMGRVDIAEESRNDFYLYVDEFQNFATESFANILSEARKYRLNLILANQYITQIEEKVRDSIFGNAGTLVSFRVGAADAEFLEKEFEPVFLQNDLVNLPKYHIYLKLMIDGVAGDAFSATTLPPVEGQEVEDVSEQVIFETRKRYTSSREQVEADIRKRSGMDELLFPSKREEPKERKFEMKSNPPHFAKASVEENEVPTHPLVTPPIVVQKELLHEEITLPQREAQPNEQNFEKQVEREQVSKEVSPKNILSEEHKTHPLQEEKTVRILYDSVCESCGVPIQVPFKPDVTRPTFCREHLKEHQRQTALARGATKSHSRPRIVQQSEPPRKEEEITLENKNTSSKVYTSSEPAMSLSQMQYVAPKKFRSLQKPNSNDIRTLLESLKRNGPQENEDTDFSQKKNSE
ncbi:MAG: type IV secretion system DNA-binding domain-containing protein [Candidatus Moraniibacteriota bacterium]|nr:MAG: type IV secretion system DNA-binding domain-containing protein [Candidatus Moranbacteria bacterium]